MDDFTADLRLTLEDAKELYLALGTRTFVLERQGQPAGRLRSLQGRVDTIWAMLEHVEKVRRGYTGEEIPRTDAVEGLAAGSDYVPYA